MEPAALLRVYEAMMAGVPETVANNTRKSFVAKLFKA